MHMPAAQSPFATSIGGFCEVSVKYRALAPIELQEPHRVGPALLDGRGLGRGAGRAQRVHPPVDLLLDHVQEGLRDRAALRRVAEADLPT
jgi:hypothetical protein